MSTFFRHEWPLFKDDKDPSADRKGSQAVKARSEGQCEVVVEHALPGLVSPLRLRCRNRADQVHHMIGGRGNRGIGKSAFAEHKQHVCDTCHRDITGRIGGKKLKRIGGPLPLWTDRYTRVK